MWNILIVLIIAIILWFMNPLGRVNLTPSSKVDRKTQSEVNQAVEQTQQQVDYARNLQLQQEQQINQSENQ